MTPTSLRLSSGPGTVTAALASRAGGPGPCAPSRAFPASLGGPSAPGSESDGRAIPDSAWAQPRRTDVLFKFPAIPSRSCAGLQVTQWYRDSG